MFLDEMVDLLKGQVDLHDKNSKKDTLECPSLSVCHFVVGLYIRFIYIFFSCFFRTTLVDTFKEKIIL